MAKRTALQNAAIKDLVQLIREHKKIGELTRRKQVRSQWPVWLLVQRAGGVCAWQEKGVRLNGPMYAACEIGAQRVARKYDLTRIQEMLLFDAMLRAHGLRPQRHNPLPGMSRAPVSYAHFDEAPLKAARSSWRTLEDVYHYAWIPIRTLLSPKLTEIILRLQLESITK